MTNEIDYGEWNPFQACPDGEDLMRKAWRDDKILYRFHNNNDFVA